MVGLLAHGEFLLQFLWRNERNGVFDMEILGGLHYQVSVHCLDIFMNTIFVGITGRVGSGKSYLAERVASALSVPCVDLDSIGHDLGEDPEVVALVRSVFGEVYVTDTGVHREKLGKLVFSDPQKMDALNAIFFPRIRTRVEADLRQATTPLVIIVGALIKELGLDSFCTHLIGVDAEDELIEQHIGEKFLQIAPSQRSRASYQKEADHVILNSFDQTAVTTIVDYCRSLLPNQGVFSITAVLAQSWKAFLRDPFVMVPYIALGFVQFFYLSDIQHFSQPTVLFLLKWGVFSIVQVFVHMITASLTLDSLLSRRVPIQTVCREVLPKALRLLGVTCVAVSPILLVGVGMFLCRSMMPPALVYGLLVGILTVIFVAKGWLDSVPFVLLTNNRSVGVMLRHSWWFFKSSFWQLMYLNMTCLSLIFVVSFFASLLHAAGLPLAVVSPVAIGFSNAFSLIMVGGVYLKRRRACFFSYA